MSFLDKVFRFRKKPPSAPRAASVQVGEKKQETVKKNTVVAVQPKTTSGLASRVLLSALTTEKTTKSQERENAYTFAVSRFATKGQVVEAIRSLYGVIPTRVNMVRVRGKHVRFGQTQGNQKDWKKAIVALKAGEHISLAGGAEK